MVCFAWRHCGCSSVIITIFCIYLHDVAERLIKGFCNGT